MKGIVFTEFLEMVEDKFGFETVDEIIIESKVPSEGAYTAIGTYDHSEMVSLVMALHQSTSIPVSDLLKVYGEHLFSRFAKLYPQFFEMAKDSLSFLERIDEYIHAEVLKLYPDAELPHFDVERQNENTLQMTYRSDRSMADFAYGLITGCFKHFNEKGNIEMIPEDDKGRLVVFNISVNKAN